MNDLPAYTIIDIRGFLIRDIMGSQYKSEVDSNGDTFASWQEGLAAFVGKTLMPLLESGVPTPSVIACWDGGNSYRLGKFADYKKRRLARESSVEQRANLKVYFEQAKRLLAYLGIKSVVVPGEEADDLIALLCERLEARHILVVTVDKDLCQLTSETISVMCGGVLYSVGSF